MNRSVLVAIVIIVSLSSLAFVYGSDAGCDEIEGNCTGYYVGKDVSSDGTAMFGQTADCYRYGPSHYEVVEASDVPGRFVKGQLGFEYELPDNTYGYIILVNNDPNGIHSRGSEVLNSEGVSYTGSITAISNETALNCDDYVKTGVYEDSIGHVIGACCDSARSGMELLCKLIDEKGSAESAIFMIADQTETWYIECYTGHQYAAIRLPTDRMAVFGNEFNLRTTAEGTDSMTSKNLVSLAEDNGFAVYIDGELDLKKTYAKTNLDVCHMRTWRGHSLFSSTDVGDYNNDREYGLLFVPSEKVSLKQILDLTRDRYEGTRYCPEETGAQTRIIGVETMQEAHVIQVHDDLPKDMCLVCWGCLSSSEDGVFVPFSNMMTKFSKAFGSSTDPRSLDDSTFYGQIKLITSIAISNKSIVKEPIVSYWSDFEKYIIEVYPDVLANALKLYSQSTSDASDYLTRFSIGIEDKVFEDAKRLYHDTSLHIIKTKMSEPKTMTAMIDVKDYAERFGWTYSASENRIEMTYEEHSIVIDDTSTFGEYKCTVTVDGISKDVASSVWKGSYMIPLEFSKVFWMGDSQAIIHENTEDPGVNGTILAISAVILAVIILAFIAFKVKSRKT